jgi:hypothetical protein
MQTKVFREHDPIVAKPPKPPQASFGLKCLCFSARRSLTEPFKGNHRPICPYKGPLNAES